MNDFNAKREKLKQAKINLKKHFVGIDDIIDDVIEKMNAWYLFPDAALRPLIINLWGLTGVGKTDLIRKLTQELDLSDTFMEIQMSNKGDSNWEKTIHSKLMRSDLEPGQPGVLLLDEFQRFRTIDDTGHEILDYNLQDVWMLLSDGKFSGASDLRGQIMEEMMDISYSRSNYDDDEDDDDDDITINLRNGTTKTKKKKTKKERMFHMSYWRAKRLKRMLGLQEEIAELMTWNEDQVYQKLQNALEQPNMIQTESDYSKLLIFVSGNLDEAFKSAANVSDADKDADEVHKRTKKINMITIKNALQHRFKPEQISRLGNIHIVYPSLDKKSFLGIIENRLRLLETRLEAVSNVRIELSDCIRDNIYHNGVFPTQGVRPVLSTVDDFISRVIPNPLIEALEFDGRVIQFSIDPDVEDRVLAKVYKAEGNPTIIDIPYIGVLDDIRKKRKEDKNVILNTAVHEAGHALVYTALFGIAPSQLIVNTTSDHSAGTTYIHDWTYDKQVVMDSVALCFGGRAAEAYVFGENNISTGSSSDISQATKMLADLYRMQGGNIKELPYVLHEGNDSANRYFTKLDNSNELILADCNAQYARAKQTISDNKDFFIELINELSTNLSITPDHYCNLANKYGIKCKVVDTSESLSREYGSLYKKFLEGIEED